MENHRIINAINTTISTIPEYFENTCKQRLTGGAGSIFDGIKTIEEMKDWLERANWEEAKHPDVMPGCTAFKTRDIPGGRMGLVPIASLPEEAVIAASDPKGTGAVSMTVSGILGAEAPETWLILGDEAGEEVVFTFHPGEPVRPSILSVKDCPDGTILTKKEAINLGFDFAKIV